MVLSALVPNQKSTILKLGPQTPYLAALAGRWNPDGCLIRPAELGPWPVESDKQIAKSLSLESECCWDGNRYGEKRKRVHTNRVDSATRKRRAARTARQKEIFFFLSLEIRERSQRSIRVCGSQEFNSFRSRQTHARRFRNSAAPPAHRSLRAPRATGCPSRPGPPPMISRSRRAA